MQLPFFVPQSMQNAPSCKGNEMTDIVERLRAYDNNGTASWLVPSKAANEIERLEKENESLKASVYGLYELEKELYEIQAREAKLREALDTTLGCVDGYYIPALKDEFALADAPYDDTALKEYRKKVLLEAADVLEEKVYSTEDGHLHSEYHAADELRRMAEE